jgi:hypothetical protein
MKQDQIKKKFQFYVAVTKMWNASRFCVSSLRRGHANLHCIVPILVYVLAKQTLKVITLVYLLKISLLFIKYTGKKVDWKTRERLTGRKTDKKA